MWNPVGNRVMRGIIFELLLLLLLIYIGLAMKVDDGYCRLGSINGIAGGVRGGSKLEPEKEIVCCQYIGVPQGPCTAIGIERGRDGAVRDPGNSWHKEGVS